MSALDARWTEYLRLQGQLGRRRRVDPIGWGLEAGLNHLLLDQADGEGVKAATEQGAARERNQARLRSRYLDHHEVDDPSVRLEDLDRLHHVLAIVCCNDRDRKLLVHTGLGATGNEVAKLICMRPDAVRQRIARLRRHYLDLIKEVCAA